MDWLDELPEKALADHWDPEPHARVYYRHARTGDLGYLVRREGQDHIRMDRPMDDSTRTFRAGEWLPEHDRRPLTVAQLAQVAFAADLQLCRWMGMHEESKKEWVNLREEERIEWMQHAPKGEVIRRRLYAGVMAALKPYTG